MTGTERRGLPRRPIFWTLDQVADMLSISEESLTRSYVWFDGQEVGPYRKQYLRAVNLHKGFIAAPRAGHPPQLWRVAENELLRWMTFHKLWLYDDEALTTVLPDALRGAPSEARGTVVDMVLTRTAPDEGTEDS